MNRRPGFTFVELLIIIVIIGILTGLAIPKFRSTFANFELQSYAKDIYYLERYLQSSSIAQGQVYFLNIDKTSRNLSACYKKDGQLKKIAGRFGKIYQLPTGVEISTDPDGKPGINFYPDASTDKIIITFENKFKTKYSIIAKGASGVIQIQ